MTSRERTLTGIVAWVVFSFACILQHIGNVPFNATTLAAALTFILAGGLVGYLVAEAA